MEIVLIIIAILAFLTLVFILAVVNTDNRYLREELIKSNNFFIEKGYPVGYTIDDFLVVTKDHRGNCKECFFHFVDKDDKDVCNKPKVYGPCYSSARADKYSIKFINKNEKSNQA